ncbi:hypothetical protein CCH79_00003068, partial [Gambusia affinis]
VESTISKVAVESEAAVSQPVSKVKQKARAVLQEMVANISPPFIRLTGWVLLRLFNGFFWSIQIHKGQLEMVKKAASEHLVRVICKEAAAKMELSDGLLLPVSNGEQWCNHWKHPNEDPDRSTSPSVLRSGARMWNEGLLNRKRPFVGRCCHSCTPQSREQLFHPNIPSLGLRNVIYINETNTRQRGWLARRLSYVLFVMERDVHKDMFTRNVVDKRKLPMVFLPVHKSHIDYLLITLILFCHNIKAPHIAAGNNLSIPILSTVIRKLGGFFIRRRMEETVDGKRDILYRSLLHTASFSDLLIGLRASVTADVHASSVTGSETFIRHRNTSTSHVSPR